VPAPNVDSAIVEVVIKNDPNTKKPIDESLFFEVVHYCFKQRRKTLINNLREAYSHYQRDFFESMLQSLGLRMDVRAEALNIDDFIHISDYLYHHQT
jgi:16S rRNA (adenine1518-N6/adenine1519-N6)-dimethyltransferase